MWGKKSHKVNISLEVALWMKIDIMRNLNDGEFEDNLRVEQILQESNIIWGWEFFPFLLQYGLSHPMFK
jgi:hypothetical protein